MTAPAPLTIQSGGVKITLDAEALREIVTPVVRETMERVGDDGRLAYSETEAASMLGVARHCLRDSRLRGEVHATKIGKSYRYSRAELLRLLSEGDS